MESAEPAINEWLGRTITHQRELILAAAQQAFSEEGYRQTEMRTIAKRAGIGKTTIYKHFISKEALFLAIVEANLNHMRGLAMAALITSSSPWERIELAAKNVLSFIENNKGMVRVIVQEAGEFDGEIQKRYITTTKQSIPLAEAFFEQFRDEGNMRDLPTGQVLQLMVKLIIGITYTWSMEEEDSLVDEGLRCLEMLKLGLTVN